MSQSMHICCMDCKEELWVGQRDSFYSGEPHTMEALRQFFIKHRSYYAPRTEGDEYHELIYIPEPYNEYIKNYHTDNWVKWDADKFRTPNTPRLSQRLANYLRKLTKDCKSAIWTKGEE